MRLGCPRRTHIARASARNQAAVRSTDVAPPRRMTTEDLVRHLAAIGFSQDAVDFNCTEAELIRRDNRREYVRAWAQKASRKSSTVLT